ncbi:hypothetical protein SBD_8036 [Streptomyces bottropensis ATCC 25435]|uniref:Uncharacterized protein n=1 Tax=Streptomyces bottropensis ATCC 25435 TaxID=1054862 RepID=M3D2Y4_9ACTN|nr:hypothetical protein SBD_8036 [Streptomyces bottropensis ATCC 25435]
MCLVGAAEPVRRGAQAVSVQESVPIIEVAPKAFQPLSSLPEQRPDLTDRFCPELNGFPVLSTACDVP